MSSPREAVETHVRTARAGQSIVVNDLKRFGPQVSAAPLSLKQAENYCKSLAQRHYENFSVASILVPKSIRQDFFNVYAYCRWSDDLADEVSQSSEAIRLLAWWRTELHRCFRGAATHPVFVAIQATCRQHLLTMEPFEDLLDAFTQDQSVTRYETDGELYDYCRRSANPVGRILLQLARVDSPDAVRLSDRVCTGLQIANFCQDLQRDSQKNRIYLPRERWLRYPITEAEILAGVATPQLRIALKDWVSTAWIYLADGLSLSQHGPRWLARDVQLFARGGLTILENIARSGFNVWGQPIEVTRKQKFALLIRAILQPRSKRLPTRLSSPGTIDA
jgi:squalene synthase HpnC